MLLIKKPPHLKTLPQNLTDVKYWRDTLLARFPILKTTGALNHIHLQTLDTEMSVISKYILQMCPCSFRSRFIQSKYFLTSHVTCFFSPPPTAVAGIQALATYLAG